MVGEKSVIKNYEGDIHSEKKVTTPNYSIIIEEEKPKLKTKINGNEKHFSLGSDYISLTEKLFDNSPILKNKVQRDMIEWVGKKGVNISKSPRNQLEFLMDWNLRKDLFKIYFQHWGENLINSLEENGKAEIEGQIYDISKSPAAFKQKIGRKFNDLLRDLGYKEESNFFKNFSDFRSKVLYSRLEETLNKLDRPKLEDSLSNTVVCNTVPSEKEETGYEELSEEELKERMRKESLKRRLEDFQTRVDKLTGSLEEYKGKISTSKEEANKGFKPNEIIRDLESKRRSIDGILKNWDNSNLGSIINFFTILDHSISKIKKEVPGDTEFYEKLEESEALLESKYWRKNGKKIKKILEKEGKDNILSEIVKEASKKAKGESAPENIPKPEGSLEEKLEETEKREGISTETEEEYEEKDQPPEQEEPEEVSVPTPSPSGGEPGGPEDEVSPEGDKRTERLKKGGKGNDSEMSPETFEEYREKINEIREDSNQKVQKLQKVINAGVGERLEDKLRDTHQTVKEIADGTTTLVDATSQITDIPKRNLSALVNLKEVVEKDPTAAAAFGGLRNIGSSSLKEGQEKLKESQNLPKPVRNKMAYDRLFNMGTATLSYLENHPDKDGMNLEDVRDKYNIDIS